MLNFRGKAAPSRAKKQPSTGIKSFYSNISSYFNTEKLHKLTVYYNVHKKKTGAGKAYVLSFKTSVIYIKKYI